MVRAAVIVVSAVFMMAGAGCAICNSEFDRDYGAFGGSWNRHDRSEGRVGSAFGSAGDRVALGTSQALDEQSEEDVPAETEEGMDSPTVPDLTDPPEGTPDADR